MTSDKDEICGDVQSRWIYNRIKTYEKKLFLVKNMAHEKFVTANDEEFLRDIQRALFIGTIWGNDIDSNDDLVYLMQNS